MPISSSARKALRVSRKKFLRNQEIRKNLKKAIKKTTEANINETFSIVDKAAKNEIIHKNKASRIKSQLAKKIGKTLPAAKKSKPQITAKKIVKKSAKKKKTTTIS